MRALAEIVDHKFQVFEGRFDEIANRLDALTLVPTGVGMKTDGSYGIMLLKTNLLTGLFLHTTVGNQFIVMNWKKKMSLCSPTIGL